MRHASRIASVLAVALFVLPSTAGAAPASPAGPWRPPVPGEVLRHFAYGPDPFRAGQHRGADFAARPGEPVRSACAGRVTFAGGTSAAGASRSGRPHAAGSAVSVRCGPWRVSYLPVGDVRVRAGSSVRPGTVLGRAGRDRRHAGLHLGVRREGRRWAYVDPLAFLAPVPPPALPPSPGPSPRGRERPRALPRTAPGPARPVAVPGADPLRAPGADPLPRPVPAGAPVAVNPSEPLARPAPAAEPLARPAPAAGPLAPWPVWLGLGLLLSGALGAGAWQWTGWRHMRRTRSAVAAARPDPAGMPD